MLTHPALVLKTLYPSLIWNQDSAKNSLYLTFDDGPTEGVTNELLDLLKKHKAKATFFCIGKNIEANPLLYRRILDEGHEIGNHTFSHKNGWKSSTLDYLKDVQKFDSIHKSVYFRPPYGRMKPAHIQALKGKYKIMMWSALSMDYNARIDKETCYQNANKKLKKGDILLFHDSLKAKSKMLYAVERILKERSSEGFTFETLSN